MGKLGKSACKSIYQISTCHFRMPTKYIEFKRITYQYHIYENSMLRGDLFLNFKIFIVRGTEFLTNFLQYHMRPSNVSVVSLATLLSAMASHGAFCFFWFTREC